AGAGKPTLVEMENNLIRGIRKASDFLMALQLTGAFKKSVLANLQVRLPAIVIGGGLTAIDTATELLAYYTVQVEKTLDRFERLAAERGEADVWKMYGEEGAAILREHLKPGRAVRAERARAKVAGDPPNFVPLLESWGGVSICYRKSVQDSPAYRLNHEEVIKCLEEGVRIVEKVSPKKATADKYGALAQVTFESPNGDIELPARTMCVAAGTSPNVIYEKEHPGTFALDSPKQFFQAHAVENGQLVAGNGFFTSYAKDAHHETFYGDSHPTYPRSLVKAMASARDGFPHIVALYERELATLDPRAQPHRELEWQRMIGHLDIELLPRVAVVNRLTPTIVEVVVRAPAAARKFQPGQFY